MKLDTIKQNIGTLVAGAALATALTQTGCNPTQNDQLPETREAQTAGTIYYDESNKPVAVELDGIYFGVNTGQVAKTALGLVSDDVKNFNNQRNLMYIIRDLNGQTQLSFSVNPERRGGYKGISGELLPESITNGLTAKPVYYR